MTIEDIARCCHEANRIICEDADDFSIKPWDEAEEWQRQSTISGVRHVIMNPSISPEELHERWVEFKLSDGWEYGEVKDAERKTHPCLVEYSQLPEYQKLKDKMFRSVVTSLNQ